ncbi:MAG: hypothetical protein HYU36_03275 [Planctomycetes bacterium]|nr:hypothetical protein [Planctomycetota bacterium]
MSQDEYILGIWDGHDSGAAMVRGGQILYAINEERLSRRKLEVGFPKRSIELILRRLDLSPASVKHVAVSTFDFAKTLTRLFPSMKEEYYLIRRRKKRPGVLTSLKKRAKYTLTEWPPSGLTRRITLRVVGRELERLGFRDFELETVDHHECHAVAAAACSGFDEAAVITIDGIGDALSGTVNLWRRGQLERRSTLSGRESLGIFFEHVTNLLNMRELEDEGKVMALATYAYPVPDEKNPMLSWFQVDGLTVHARYGAHETYARLRDLLWQYPSEQFAYMAQRTLEVKAVEFVRKVVKDLGVRRVALAGGIFANILVNRLIRLSPEVESCFVFPHMGDGGLALGAAMSLNARRCGVTSYPFQDVFFGTDYTDEEMQAALAEAGVPSERVSDAELPGRVADLLLAGKIGLWFQGRMEYGPRALGARSIIAHPGSEKAKDELNLRLKRRVWYQPFCPSMLESAAAEIFEDFRGQLDPFMTNAYKVKEAYRDRLRGVIHIDGTCRPQILGPAQPAPHLYRELLEEVGRRTGLAVILNTSFNLHGEPLVCSPADSLRTFRETRADYLVLGNTLAHG